MFAKKIIYAAHNIILMKIDDELLYKIFWEPTSRFDYELRVRINDHHPNVDYIDFHKDFIIIATDEENENKLKHPRIEITIDLVWKVESFNRLKNVRKNEIAQIHEVWIEEDGNMKLVESNFDDDARKDLFKLHLETPIDNNRLLTDSESEGIIDVDFVEVNNNQIDMNNDGA